jgi:hypothetical protein
LGDLRRNQFKAKKAMDQGVANLYGVKAMTKEKSDQLTAINFFHKG